MVFFEDNMLIDLKKIKQNKKPVLSIHSRCFLRKRTCTINFPSDSVRQFVKAVEHHFINCPSASTMEASMHLLTGIIKHQVCDFTASKLTSVD